MRESRRASEEEWRNEETSSSGQISEVLKVVAIRNEFPEPVEKELCAMDMQRESIGPLV
jgi:hypothetical protein